jgi:formylglycine-generating enzyme required for sulfatase activity
MKVKLNLRVAWIAACVCLLAIESEANELADNGVPPPRAVAPFDGDAARAHQKSWADHLGTTVETTNSIGLKLVLIPPGEFLMGSTPEQIEQAMALATKLRMSAHDKRYILDEGPQHRVALTRPFRLSATEITVGQFRRFLEATGYKTETERLGGGNTHRRTAPTEYVHDPALSYAAPGYPVTDNSPVTQVTWNDAVAFCDWLGRQEQARYRLPTEAEWEYAARAGTTTEYSFGDDLNRLGEYGWYGKNSNGRSGAVGTKLCNPFGLYDMHGNTREWCADWYGKTWYKHSPTEDPLGPEQGAGRVLRGGKWFNKEPFLRSAYRFDMWPSYRSRYFGFRVACELP